jgi:hypothetical protein
MIKKFEGEKMNFLKLLRREQEKYSRQRISSPRIFLLSAKSASPRAQGYALAKEYYSRQKLYFRID